MKFLITISALLSPLLLGVNSVNAQNFGTQCRDGGDIVRCQTFDCPQGDTNGDGECTLDDTGSRISDARNDAFCANPISGCGVVQYYKTNENLSCEVRVKENNNNCDLYQAGNPDFSSPTPSPTPAPTADPDSQNKCISLKTNPANGKAPLSVGFTGTASSDAVNFQFDFGDEASVTQSVGVARHTYDAPGTYTATLKIKGENGKFVGSDACKATVLVTDKEDTGGKILPKTGSDTFKVVALIFSGFAGLYLFKKYQIN